MNPEAQLASRLANLARDFEARAAAIEAAAPDETMTAAAQTYRICAADTLHELRAHRNGPAWQLPETSP